MKKIISFLIIIGILAIGCFNQTTMAFSMNDHNNIENKKVNDGCCSGKEDEKSHENHDCCINASNTLQFASIENILKIKELKNSNKTFLRILSIDYNIFIFENIQKIIPPNYILDKYSKVYLTGIIKLNI